MVDNIRYLPPLGKSDHLVIQFSLITYINRFRTQTEKLNFFKANYDQLRPNLKEHCIGGGYYGGNESKGVIGKLYRHNQQ